jgi:hypothetical protein
MGTLPDNAISTADAPGDESPFRTSAIIDKFNELGVGDTVSIPQVYNLARILLIWQFVNSLEARGCR